jgi:hypothetical protein
MQFVVDLRQVNGFTLGTLVTCTSTNETDGHDLTESGAKHHNPNPDIIYELH